MTSLERRILEICARAIAYPDKPELQEILTELFHTLEEYELRKRERKSSLLNAS